MVIKALQNIWNLCYLNQGNNSQQSADTTGKQHISDVKNSYVLDMPRRLLNIFSILLRHTVSIGCHNS
jgi:hypothetical protein